MRMHLASGGTAAARSHRALCALGLVALWACNEGAPAGDTPEAGPATDAKAPDGALATPDAAPSDAAAPDAAPDAAPPDASPDAAPPDARPDASPDAGPDAGWLRHEALGSAPLEAALTLAVPVGAESVLIQARGRPGGFYAIVDVEGPRGPLTGAVGEGRWRTSFNPEVAVALWPGSDQADLLPGDYTFRVVAAGPQAEPVEVDAWLKAGARSLAIDVLYPPDLAWEIDHPSVVRMARALEQRLAAVLGLPVTATPRLLRPEAPADLDLDTRLGDFGALGDLARATPADLAGGIAVYVMGDVRDGGTSQSGFAGGLPAPFALPGTAAAVIAVRSPLLEMFPEAVADLAAHELGHGLGLYHTTEPFADRHDPLGDTPECSPRCDRDGDGVLLASECGRQGMGMPPCQGTADNFMFWTVGGRRDHSPVQRRITRGHPAVAP